VVDPIHNKDLLSDSIKMSGGAEISVTVPDTNDTASNDVILGKEVTLGLNEGSIGADKLADATITDDKIKDGTIKNASLENSAITVNTSEGIEGGAEVSLGDSVNLVAAAGYTGKIEYSFDESYGSTTESIPTDNTVPQSSEGVSLITKEVTPTRSGSTYIVQASFYGETSAATIAVATLFSSTSTNAIGVTWQSVTAAQQISLTVSGVLVTSSADPVTFSLRAGTSVGTLYVDGNSSNRIFGGVPGRTLVITEILA